MKKKQGNLLWGKIINTILFSYYQHMKWRVGLGEQYLTSQNSFKIREQIIYIISSYY